MKKPLALLLTLLLFLSSFPFTFAEDLIDTDFTFTEESPVEEPLPDEEPAPEPDEPQAKAVKEDFDWDGMTITGYKGKGGKVVIPEEWGVEAIAADAFESNETITALTIPSTVTTLGPFMCYAMKNLKSVTINAQTDCIPDDAFALCRKLTTVKLPNTLQRIDREAFCACTALKSLKLPTSVREIGPCAFLYCAKLTGINLPEGITELPSSAFRLCTSLSTLKLPSTLRSIGRAAFAGCKSLKSIVIPEGVTEIGEYAFGRVERDDDDFGEEDELYPEDFGKEPYFGCQKLKTVTLPDSLSECTENAFEGIDKSLCTFNVYQGSNAHYICEAAGCKIAFRKDYQVLIDYSGDWWVDFISPFSVVTVPSDYGFGNFDWKLSSEKLAAFAGAKDVSACDVKFLAEGKLTVTCKVEIPGIFKKTMSVKNSINDPLKPLWIQVWTDDYSLVYPNDDLWTIACYGMVYPGTAQPDELSWKLSSTKVAEISSVSNDSMTQSACYIVPKKAGSTTVTLTAKRGKVKKTASQKLTIVDPNKFHSVSIRDGATFIEVGETIDYFEAASYPQTLDVAMDVTWKSSAPKVATVVAASAQTVDRTSMAAVTGVKPGKATITCTMQYNGVKKSDSVKVTVVE